MRTGKLTPQSTANIKANIWVKAYETTLTEATTSLTISGLTGDTDKEYKLEARIVNGYNGSCNYYVRPNNVSTASNYGWQYVKGVDSVASAGRGVDSGLYLHANSTLGYVLHITMLLFAKSGYVRTAKVTTASSVTGTTVTQSILFGESWNNTADEITSLVILADQANGLGIGTNIVLWKRSYK